MSVNEKKWLVMHMVGVLYLRAAFLRFRVDSICLDCACTCMALVCAIILLTFTPLLLVVLLYSSHQGNHHHHHHHLAMLLTSSLCVACCPAGLDGALVSGGKLRCSERKVQQQ
jgi:hypothetical protein